MKPAGTRWLGLGRRGLMLVTLSLLWIWVGTNILLGGPVYVESLIHTYQWFPLRVAEWWVPAALGLFFAWRTVDTWGWAALMVGPVVRAASYLWGWFVWLIPGGDEGYSTGAWSSALYLFMIAVVAVCVGWPDHPPRPEVTTGESEETLG